MDHIRSITLLSIIFLVISIIKIAVEIKIVFFITKTVRNNDWIVVSRTKLL